MYLGTAVKQIDCTMQYQLPACLAADFCALTAQTGC